MVKAAAVCGWKVVSGEISCLSIFTEEREDQNQSAKTWFEALSNSSGTKYTCSVLHLRKRTLCSATNIRFREGRGSKWSFIFFCDRPVDWADSMI